MGLFGGSKKKKAEGEPAIPETSEFPLKAYVYRLLPEKVGRVQVAGRVPGDYDGWTAAQDLEDMVAKLCGGGTYRCKVVKSGETKTHIGYHNFTIPGAPLMEGQPITERSDETKPREANKVAKIEQEIEEEEAQAKLDEARARRRQKQKSLGLLKDDEDDEDADDTSPPTFGMPGFEDPRVSQLLASQKALEKRLEEKDREMLVTRHEAEMRTLKSEMERKIDSIAQRPSGDGGVGAMLSAQMEAIKAMMTSSQQQTNAMLQSNAEMIKMIMSRDPSTGINERVDRLVERLLESKTSSTKEQMDVMKEAWQTGIMMGRGGEPTPTSMVDVAREFSGRVLDIVGEFMRQKGQMTKETMAQEIQKATSRVVEGLKRSFTPQIGLRSRSLPPGGIPAEAAMPDNEPASALGRDELRARVDQVMQTFLADIENGTEDWKAVAQAQIPATELQRIGAFTFDNVAQYCMVHGSPQIVRDVMTKLLAIGAVTLEQANMLLASYNITERITQVPAAAPVQVAGEVLADEAEDEALMGDEEAEGTAQGEAIPAEPEPVEVEPAPEKPKRRRK